MTHPFPLPFKFLFLFPSSSLPLLSSSFHIPHSYFLILALDIWVCRLFGPRLYAPGHAQYNSCPPTLDGPASFARRPAVASPRSMFRSTASSSTPTYGTGPMSTHTPTAASWTRSSLPGACLRHGRTRRAPIPLPWRRVHHSNSRRLRIGLPLTSTLTVSRPFPQC